MPRTACPRIKRNRAQLALATDITHTFLSKLQFRFLSRMELVELRPFVSSPPPNSSRMNERKKSWWVFDRPLLRDPFVWAAITLSVVATLIDRDMRGLPLWVVLANFCWYLISGISFIGVVFGSIREYSRGKRAG